MYKKEAIFAARVEYKYNSNVPERRIEPHSYIVKSETRSDDLESDLKSLFQIKLPEQMKEIYGIDVKISIKKVEYGSISIFFGALVQGYQLIASYKSFIDSIRLIQEQASELLGSHMKNKYGEEFNTSVSAKYPSLDDRYLIDDLFMSKRHRRLLPFFNADEFPDNQNKRDGFFWFLLVMNILLTSAIGVIVYGAVMKTYFGP